MSDMEFDPAEEARRAIEASDPKGWRPFSPPWQALADDLARTVFLLRRVAEAAERRAILDEAPLHNTQHNSNCGRWRTFHPVLRALSAGVFLGG